MTTTELDADGFPELPAFDDRSLRRAIRRGVLRTAFVGGVWVLVAWFFLNVAGAFVVDGLGRGRHLHRVVEVGWQVAHPEFRLQGSGENMSALHANSRVTVKPVSVDSAPTSTTVEFREGIFGGVSVQSPDPTTTASQVLQSLGIDGTVGPANRENEAKTLKGLPPSVQVAAVVEFATPLDDAGYNAFVKREGTASGLVLAPALMSSALPFDAQFEGTHRVRGVYGWAPTYGLGTSLFRTVDVVTGFRQWVGSLHDSDRGALRDAGIDLGGLRAAAREGRVHGAIVTGVSGAFLLKLLADPAVEAVHIYDVAFAVEGGGS